MLPTNHPEPALAVKSMKDATGEILSFDVTEETFTPHDVVLGKGNGINCLPGNVKFRLIISKYKPLYTSTPRSLKGTVAELVINEIACLEPPGRFLEPQADKRFKQVARKRAIEKTCQALREKKTGAKLQSSAAIASAKATGTKSNHSVGPPSPSGSSSTTAPVSPPVTHAPTAVVAATPSPGGGGGLAAAAAAPPSIPLPSALPTTSHGQPTGSQQQQQQNGAPTLSSAATPMQYAQGNVDPNASGRRSADSDKKQPVWPIRENDVLYGGRGRKHFHRQANQRFLDLIKISRNDYRESSNKKLVAIGIINQWKTKQDPPGRFLQQDADSEAWYEIPSAKIQEKTCQALRDLKRERGPGGARATIADRMVDPRSNGSNSSRSSSTASQNSSSDENSSRGSNSSSKSQKRVQQVHRQPPQNQQQQPPPQQQQQLPYRPQQQPPQQPQQAYHHHGPPPYHHQPHQPMYSQPSPPQQHQQVYHHPAHQQQVSPLSPHSQVTVSYAPMPMHSVGATSPPGPHGPPPPSPQQHMPVNHHPHHVSQAHMSPGQQHGWVQDPNSRMYAQPAPHGSGMMQHEGHAPPMGQHQHYPQQHAHSMSRQAPPVHHLPARPHPPPPAYQVHNHAHSHAATPGAPPPPPPPPPQYNAMDQDPHAAAIHRQAGIVAQEMRKMDEMMRRQPSGPPPPPPPPPAGNIIYQESSHSQVVPRTVVTAAPSAPHSPPNHHHGQPPQPPPHYSPTPAANHGGAYHEASYQQTHSVVSTGASVADGSSISISSSSGDMSAPSSGLPSKEEMMRQVATTATTFAPIHSGDDEKSAASRAGQQHQAPLPRVVPPSVPVSLPRQHAGMQHNKMISLENKAVPVKVSPRKDDKTTSTSTATPPSKLTTAPQKEGEESSDENRAQGELEAASLLANMFAV